MGRPELAVTDARRLADELHVGVGIGDVGLDLLERTSGEEARSGADERDLAAVGQAGADADHVLLGDADVDRALGPALAEAGELGRADAVVDDDRRCASRARRRHRAQQRRRRGSRTGRMRGLAALMPDSTPSSPDRIAPRLGTPWCQPTWSSMKDTPLPLIVCAITHSGRARRSRGAKASSSAAGSWPSTSTTSQPKARHLSASGSRSLVSATRAPCCRRVAVDDQRQIGELAMAGRHRRLPVAALLQFAIAGDDEDAIRSARSIWPAMATPTAIGMPWPSGPVLASTPGDVIAVGMAVEHRQRLHVGRQRLDREEAGLGKRRIERAARVALAQNAAGRDPGSRGALRDRRAARRNRASPECRRPTCRRRDGPAAPRTPWSSACRRMSARLARESRRLSARGRAAASD